jgi:uncharacterized protein YdeI (YjbR/CyaY-like superfamily)
MGRKDPRVDAYIAKSAEFAKPILTQLRRVVHEGCPEVAEEMKWNFPHFTYKGMFCGMAAFKEHATFGFWKHELLVERVNGVPQLGAEAMGQFGRLTSLDDLPAKPVLLKLVREAAFLNDKGIKPARPRPAPKTDRTLEVPDDLMKALRKNRKALKAFETGSYSFRKEYVAWLADAKSEATRLRRLATAVEWMADGKGRNWKYEVRR